MLMNMMTVLVNLGTFRVFFIWGKVKRKNIASVDVLVYSLGTDDSLYPVFLTILLRFVAMHIFVNKSRLLYSDESIMNIF
jgi:hypothetical protein